MAYRTTPADVQAIITTEVTNLIPFIRVANILVDKMLSEDTSLDADQLQEIETWLAAHFLASSKDPVAKTESIGETSITYYLSEPGNGLLSTPYGQTACALDTSGRLSNLIKKRAEIRAIDLELTG